MSRTGSRLGNAAVTGAEGVKADVSSILRAHSLTGGTETLRAVPVGSLERSPWQPRTVVKRDSEFAALVDSITEHGVLEPLLARELPSGTLELLAGERRLEASRDAGRPTVPVRVLTGVNDTTARAIALTENLARQNLSAWEEAQALRMLRDARAEAGMPVDVRTLGAAAGRDRTTTGQLLTIAENLTPYVVNAARISSGTAVVSEIDGMTRAALYGAASAPAEHERVLLLGLLLRNGAPSRGRPSRPEPMASDGARETGAPPAPTRPQFSALGSPDDPRGLKLARSVDALTPADAAAALTALEPLLKALRRRAKSSA